ncbi:MAG: PEGA domain-containing protein [Chloroflexi bacterium CFX4]|nr:PEGA domain-containing protein [Chloroflexi bacterium CFX4]MDL1922009.1 PEGA domain-containing protein [Chloroflexi bacterium CFX3]
MNGSISRTLILIALMLTSTTLSSVQAQPAPAAQLFVESSPSGAVVRQDGKVLGTTPFNLTLPLDTYTFEISLAGFPTRMERFALLKAGMSATLHARMTLPLQPANWTRLLPSGVLVSDYDNRMHFLFGSNNRTDGTYNADTGAVLYSEYVQNIVDEQWLYVVYADRIVRYSADLSQCQQLLAMPFEVIWATLSLTTDYVFLAGGREGTLGDWLYRLPLY